MVVGQRPLSALDVTQRIHETTNLWKFRLNRSSESQGNIVNHPPPLNVVTILKHLSFGLSRSILSCFHSFLKDYIISGKNISREVYHQSANPFSLNLTNVVLTFQEDAVRSLHMIISVYGNKKVSLTLRISSVFQNRNHPKMPHCRKALKKSLYEILPSRHLS